MNFYEFYILINENTVSQELKKISQKDSDWYAKVMDVILKRVRINFGNSLSPRAREIFAKWVFYTIKDSLNKANDYGNNFVQTWIYNYFLDNISVGVNDFLVANIDQSGNWNPQLASKFNNPSFKPTDLIALTHQYHENLKKKQKNMPGAIGKNILSFPDGYFWTDLEKSYCDVESKAMGHCGNQGAKSGDTILSLRDEKNRPHLTFILNNGKLGEMKGKNNDKPAAKYYHYIIELLKLPIIKDVVGGGYLPENNFKLEDLTKEQVEEIVKVNNNLEENYLKILVHNKWEISEKEYIDSLQKLLTKYPKSIDEETLYKVTENDKTPPEILLTISEKGDLNFTLKLNLVANKNTPQQVLDKLSINNIENSMYNDRNYSGTLAAYSRFNVSPRGLPIIKGLNPKISSNYLNKITLYILNMLKDPKSDTDLYSFSPYILINVAEHPNTSVETLNKIISNFKLIIDADLLILDDPRYRREIPKKGYKLGADLIDALIKNNKVSEDIKNELMEKKKKYYPDAILKTVDFVRRNWRNYT